MTDILDIEDPRTGQLAWQELRPRLDALPAGGRLVNLDMTWVARQLFPLARLAQSIREPVLQLLSEAQQAKVGPAIDGLHTLAHATFFVALQFAGLKPVLQHAQALSWAGLVQEAQRLRALGLLWLDVLVALGRVTPEERARILAGRGHEDTMTDLVALARLLRQHWSLLEPLQPLHPEADWRMTEQTPDELEASASALGEGLTWSQDPGAVDWRQQLIGITHLLRRDYDAVRAAVTYYYTDQGQPEQALPFRSLEGLRRQPPRRTKGPATAPVEPAEPHEG